MGTAGFLSEAEWRELLVDIHNRKVIPVVGSELVTVPDPDTGVEIPLQRYLTPLLASKLGLLEPTRFASLNEAACFYLTGGGRKKTLYIELSELLDEQRTAPSLALLDLARISDFDLFIASTFDRQLADALTAVRPDFDSSAQVLAFRPEKPVDLPEPLGNTLLYHILGNLDTFPEFAVWEEDYMEFICGLLERHDTMERLFRLLKNRHLLLLGAPASDWIVRFFVRAARQMRLSDRTVECMDPIREYLTDRAENLEPPLTFFFDSFVKTTRVLRGDPASFVRELADRWQDRYGQATGDDEFLAQIPQEMPRDSVFISYAREDFAAALSLARGLHAAGVPIWLDKARLQNGSNFATVLEGAVRVVCSFFISLISDTTEADVDRQRFVHRERDWAAGRHVEGWVFYLPVAIHTELPGRWEPQREPASLSRIQYDHLPAGIPTPDFIRRVRQLVESKRTSGHVRS